MRNADAADRAAGASNADRGQCRLLGADAFEDGVCAETISQLAHSLDGLFTALAHNVRRAELSGERDAVVMPTHDNDPLGA